MSFKSTVFLEFLDCTQSVRVLSNLELEKLATIFFLLFVYYNLYGVCSWSVFGAIRGLVLFRRRTIIH